MAIYYLYDPNDELHPNVFIGVADYEENDFDILPAYATKIKPPENENQFKEVYFNKEKNKWLLRDNIYQMFYHKYIQDLDIDNTTKEKAQEQGFTGVNTPLGERLFKNLEEYTTIPRPHEVPSEVLETRRRWYYCDVDNMWKEAEPSLSDVIMTACFNIHIAVSDKGAIFTSDATGETLEYMSEEIDKVVQGIDFLRKKKEKSTTKERPSVPIPLANSGLQGVREVFEYNSINYGFKFHTLEQLEKLYEDFLNQKYEKLDREANLVMFISQQTDIEDAYYVRYEDAEAIADGTYVPYTQRPEYKRPEWRSDHTHTYTRSSILSPLEQVIFDIAKRENIKIRR